MTWRWLCDVGTKDMYVATSGVEGQGLWNLHNCVDVSSELSDSVITLIFYFWALNLQLDFVFDTFERQVEIRQASWARNCKNIGLILGAPVMEIVFRKYGGQLKPDTTANQLRTIGKWSSKFDAKIWGALTD